MKKKTKKIVFGSISVLLIGVLVFSCVYLNTYYKAKDVDTYLVSDDSVTVTKTKDYYFFDGSGNSDAFIFYPGAKVDTKAYAPIMYELAKEGIDTFLIDMPFHLAFFGQNKADLVLSNYDYQNVYMGGHSLGGVVASMYTEKNISKINGICYLASYSTKDFSSSSLDILSIYGSNDGVLNIPKYEESKVNLPSTMKEVIIEGGNHANFASYGFQKGDKEATISKEKQLELTIKEIKDWIIK